MKTSHTLFAIVLGAAIFVGNAHAVATSVDKAAGVAAEKWLSIPAVYDKVSKAGYVEISEIERKRDGYKIKATDADGNLVKLFVDPLNGEVLNSKAKKSAANKRGNGWFDSVFTDKGKQRTEAAVQ